MAKAVIIHAKSKDKWQTVRKYFIYKIVYIYTYMIIYMYVYVYTYQILYTHTHTRVYKSKRGKGANVPNIQNTFKNKETKKSSEKWANDINDHLKNYKNGP